MISKIFRAAAWLGLLLGVCLLTLNFVSFIYLPDRHSKTLDTSRTKAGIALQPAEQVLAELAELSDVRDEGDIKRLTKLFSAGVMHYWPVDGNWDREILTDFREDWVTAAIERIELFRLESGQNIRTDYVRRERLDYENIVSKGVGICSQVALGVADFVQKNGEEAYVWGLDGHVVAVVGPLSDGKTYIVDGDYGVYLPLTPEEIENDPSLIASSYLAGGYRPNQIGVLIDIYGPEGNFEYGTELSWRVVALRWSVPIAMLLLSISLFWLTRSRKTLF